MTICLLLVGCLGWWSEQHGHGSPQLVQPGKQGLRGVVWLLEAGPVPGEAGAGGALARGGGAGFAGVERTVERAEARRRRDWESRGSEGVLGGFRRRSGQ